MSKKHKKTTKATTTTSAAATTKTISKNRKKIAIVLLMFIAMCVLLVLGLIVFGQNPNIRKGSEIWKDNYQTVKTYYISTNIIGDNQLAVITEAGWEPVAKIPEEAPEWLIQGKKDAENGNFDVRAQFAARYYDVQYKLDKEEQSQVWALGTAYLTKSAEEFSAEGWQKIESLLVALLW